MKYKVGDRVRIKSLDWYNENKDITGDIIYKSGPRFASYMKKYCGQIMIIRYVYSDAYRMEEDSSAYESRYFWTDKMIEGLVEDEIKPCTNINDMKNDVITVPISAIVEMVKELGFSCPNGYIFKDENDNIINAQKIVLEKKKKEYPKTFLGCCDVLEIEDTISRGVKGYKSNLLDTFQKLLICRDAYWKIAGEEMGLGRPWKPDWSDYENIKYIIGGYDGEIGYDQNHHIHKILAFPTEEMRDAFYENFKSEIESCKELL